MPANPCKKCIHYDDCRGKSICNSYISKEEAYINSIEVSRSQREYREYREAYYDYTADSRD